MFEDRLENPDDIKSAILSALTVAQDRCNRGKASESKRNIYETKVAQLDKSIIELTECGNHMKDIYQNIQHYAKNHRKKAQDILDLAVIEAGNLVPDASVKGIHLDYGENNNVSILNGDGEDVNLEEGSAYRTILGNLLRYATIKAQPDALPLMLFDEAFFTLSDTTTALAKDIFSAMKKDMYIVIIEQRRNVADGIADSEYTFKKLDDTSIVTKTL